MPIARPSLALLPALTLLAACGSAEPASAPDVQRISLDQAPSRHADALPSPDTTNAGWNVDATGQAIDFGQRGGEPLMTLACTLDESPVQVVIIRHAPALPGQTALFPVLGNGMRSRFLAAAVLGEGPGGGEWHWEARLPASDPQLDVFSGNRELIATLPGRGTLEITGSRIPGEFLEWCRNGGSVSQAANPDESDAPPELDDGPPEEG